MDPKNSYQFFSNSACEFFPCHQGADTKTFNCLFCYCPLYALGDRCGGNFSYTEGGVKDCSQCLIPHSEGGYGYITKNFPKIAQLAQRPAGNPPGRLKARAFVADAFTSTLFGGNQAGGVALDRGEPFPEENLMKALAGELKHSETAFVRPLGGNRFHIRYFTPAGEVDLCGHATIAAFAVLMELGLAGDGEFSLTTAAGEQKVRVAEGKVFLTISPTRVFRELSPEEGTELLAAYGLSPGQGWPGLAAALVNSGLTDIMLPVRDHEALMAAVQNEGLVSELSRKHDAVGVHMFCPGQGGISAYCSNFAPLWDIPEECATGTANAGLTRYLYSKGLFPAGQEHLILQGEHMGRPSEIRTLLQEGGEGVQVGGQAAISMELLLRL